ncbi:MAG: Phage protein [Thermoanaerobacterium thermosaccharolyticum]|jgi:hypothetical protein
MISEIKKIIQNYLNNVKLTAIVLGIVVNGGIQISDKLTIPNELIKGNLKDFIKVGDKVRLIRNHGGQEFYIIEIIGSIELTLDIEPITINGHTITSINVKEVSR